AAPRPCGSRQPPDVESEGKQVSVRFSFTRSGEIIAARRMTYATTGATADTGSAYLKASNASLNACVPLKFTSGRGGALAGRPIAIRFVDNRKLEKQSGTP